MEGSLVEDGWGIVFVDVKMKIIVFAVDMICPLILGYLCQRQNVVKENFFNKMILNNILVVCPIVSFLSFWILPLTADLFWLPLISLALGFVPGAMAYVIAQKKYSRDQDRGAYVMAASLSNLGTIGGICVFLLYGEKGYGYQQIIVLFQYVLMFMFCYPLAQYYETRAAGGSGGSRLSLRSVLLSKNQLAVVGIVLGGVLQAAGIPRPAELDGVAQVFIHMGAWTGLIPVGYSVDFSQIKLYYKSLFDLSLIKFIAAPLLIYGLSHLVISSPVMLNTLLVLACMPSAVNAVVTARLYHLNVSIGVAAFLVTTGLFLAIVYPLLFFFLSS